MHAVIVSCASPIIPSARRRPRRGPLTFRTPSGSWSPDGQQLAGFGDHEKTGIFVYSLKTGRFTKLTDAGSFPIWLKDSRRLLFVDNRGGLFVVDSVSKATREVLSIAPDYFERAALTADNRTLYFTRASEQGDIWLLRFK